ncbi:hypothetical protein AVEN_36516-1 [Araneus ventricosus]|uniref:RNase H type-1 domain-containing protein n=1 Tax=Araneus ventricosus TaxID=182803 RepID=A0A4Y2H363_ARAVE|nr:hypothetical protein AVEN_36516-1 [Araneus ventricosus]
MPNTRNKRPDRVSFRTLKIREKQSQNWITENRHGETQRPPPERLDVDEIVFERNYSRGRKSLVRSRRLGRHLLSKGARILLFSWVPSQAGITGNELAGKSAKSATEFLTRPIVYADVLSAVNQWCH